MTETTQPKSQNTAALAWLIPGSTVTRAAFAPLGDPSLGGPRHHLVPGEQVPTRLTAAFADGDRRPTPTARRRIEVMLGAAYGGTWAGIWGTDGVELANLEYDRGDTHIWDNARRRLGVQVRFGHGATTPTEQNGARDGR